MYADDLMSVAEHREELQSALEEWNDLFKNQDLDIDIDKTDVMWVGKQREELNFRLERKCLKHVNQFVYLGGKISENGRVGVELRRIIQAGANACRSVDGVMLDRTISRKLKVMDSCLVPASTVGLETLALSELNCNNIKVQACENNSKGE